jgi:hypothetical protein
MVETSKNTPPQIIDISSSSNTDSNSVVVIEPEDFINMHSAPSKKIFLN